MIVKTFVEPPIENNNYLLIDEESKEAILIDCSNDDAKIQETLKEYDAKLKGILLTHGHFDHILGIKQDNKIPVYMNKNDMLQVDGMNKYLPYFNLPPVEIPKITNFVEDEQTIMLGDKEIKIITTPGHTQGGVCYYVEDMLFSGDTIFKESVGRCDLEGGDFEQIVESIKNKIFTLPPKTKIFPGHGQATSVGWEKEHNNFM